MQIRVKVDEDLPAELTERLRASGHDAQSVLDQGLQGTSDEALWPTVQAENRWLFTADKGFADIRIHPPGSHAGVVLFRLSHESRRGYLRLLDYVLKQLDLADMAGAIIVVSPEAIRIHGAGRPPR